MKKENVILKGIAYFLITFAITGALFVIQVILTVPGDFQLPMYGPAITALIFLWIVKKSIFNFLKNSFTFRINLPILFALFLPIVLIGFISLWTQFYWGLSNLITFNPNTILFVVLMFFAVIGEELGWRGYLLPKLQERFSPITSSVIVGLYWIVWHLPTKIMPIHLFICWATTIFSINLWQTFIYNKAKPSVWPSILLHFMNNIMIYLFLQQYLIDFRISVFTSILFLVSSMLLALFDRKSLTTKPNPV